MYYYQHHIGDFDRATRHLTRIERSVYLDLIFMYYETERALPLDAGAVCRKIVARSEEEKTAVVAILDEFFHETPNGWFHDRCEEEIADYRKKSSQASTAGKASAAARAERRSAAMNATNPSGIERRSNGGSTDVERPLNGCTTDGQQTVNGPSTNHKPLTTNQEPVTNEVKSIVPPDGATGIVVERRSEVVEAVEGSAPLAVVKQKASAPRIDFGDDARSVFSYWQQKRSHDRAKLDDKRAKAIKARLKDGYTVGDLCRAVDGIAKSSYHMGQNDSSMVYDDIELICRTAANVDKFIKLADGGAGGGLQRQGAILKDWI